MAFHHDFPFGIDRICLHIKGQSKRVLINPNDPASVYDAIPHLMAVEVEKATFKATENPEFDAWRAAVANRETMDSFADWKESKHD